MADIFKAFGEFEERFDNPQVKASGGAKSSEDRRPSKEEHFTGDITPRRNPSPERIERPKPPNSPPAAESKQIPALGVQQAPQPLPKSREEITIRRDDFDFALYEQRLLGAIDANSYPRKPHSSGVMSRIAKEMPGGVFIALLLFALTFLARAIPYELSPDLDTSSAKSLPVNSPAPKALPGINEVRQERTRMKRGRLGRDKNEKTPVAVSTSEEDQNGPSNVEVSPMTTANQGAREGVDLGASNNAIDLERTTSPSSLVAQPRSSNATPWPTRLPSGTRIEVELKEPASSLGGPVTAQLVSELRVSGILIPSGTEVQVPFTTGSIAGRVGIANGQIASLSLPNGQSLSFHSYLEGEDGGANLPTVNTETRDKGAFKKFLRGLIAVGGQVATRRNRMAGQFVSSVSKGLAEPTVESRESPLPLVPIGTRFWLITQ